MEQALFKTIKEIDGPHWNPMVHRAWSIVYLMVRDKMLLQEKYDHNQNLDLNQCRKQQNSLAEASFSYASDTHLIGQDQDQLEG
jgi:hypothetical protein